MVPTAEGWEVLSVSVGPSALLWAVTWAGTAIVRLGVTWQTLMGEYSCLLVFNDYDLNSDVQITL